MVLQKLVLLTQIQDGKHSTKHCMKQNENTVNLLTPSHLMNTIGRA